MTPALNPPSGRASVTAGRIDCPRCGQKTLNPVSLVCWCSAEFTPEGLEHFRSLIPEHARRPD